MELNGLLHNVFREYVGEVHRMHEEAAANRKKVKDIMLDVIGGVRLDDTVSDRIDEGLNDLLRTFGSKDDFEADLDLVIKTREKFEACIANFCKAAGISTIKMKHCTLCGEPVEGRGTACSACIAKNGGKKCPACGTVIQATSGFCTECGGKL
jgi:predicted nucleic acid-binding Zn ribbon protein